LWCLDRDEQKEQHSENKNDTGDEKKDDASNKSEKHEFNIFLCYIRGLLIYPTKD